MLSFNFINVKKSQEFFNNSHSSCFKRAFSCSKCNFDFKNNKILCSNCSQPNVNVDITKKNYWEIFEKACENDKPSCKIDEKKLANEYHFLVRLFHPDHLNSDDSKDKLKKINEINSYLTTGFNSLKDPVKRVISYFKQIHNIELFTENSGFADIDFLQEIIDLEDTLNSIDDEETLKLFFQTKNREKNNLVKNLLILIDEFQKKQKFSNDKELENIKIIITKYKFLTKLLTQADEKLIKLQTKILQST